MRIGCVKEIKKHEYRVGLTPMSVKQLVKNNHQVFVENNSGLISGFTNDDYIKSGAVILNKEEVWNKSDMIIKVKEPLKEEYKYLREDLILYTYLHLASNKPLTEALLNSKTKAIAYETIQKGKDLPCLRPMSVIAGRLGVIEGSRLLSIHKKGEGILISGVPGVERGKIVIIGAGVVGENSIKMAIGLNANVTVLDIDINKLTYLDDLYKNKITTLYSNEENIINSLKNADIVIGAVLLPGAKAPKLIKKEYLIYMKKGSVIVDIAIDQGGSCETSKPTYHDNPTYEVDNIIHYCVANIPGAVPKTSTISLNNATLPYALKLANLGFEEAVKSLEDLKYGVNTYKGYCTYKAVSEAFNLEYRPIETFL